MGSINGISALTKGLGTIGTLVNTADSVINSVQGFNKINNDEQARTALRAEHDLTLKQLQEKQNIQLSQAEADLNLQKTSLLQSQQTEDDQRQASLRRAVARKQAELGAKGLNSTDGSGKAILLGLIDESESEKQKRENIDRLRQISLDQDFTGQKQINLLQTGQLLERQRLERATRF